MPSPFPGMDPYLEKPPIFHELHTQMLAEIQWQLQRQIRPRYVARMERHLSEGSVWGLDIESLERKEPDVAIVASGVDGATVSPMIAVAEPVVVAAEELSPEELELRKQRRIVIYVNDRPRLAVTGIELLSPTNKKNHSLGRDRYLEKRASALHGGLQWVEIDLLRGGVRPPMPIIDVPPSDYLAYTAQATDTGWRHSIYAWQLSDSLPVLRIPLLGNDMAAIDLEASFREAYDRIAADDEADYQSSPPRPSLSTEESDWVDSVLRKSGRRG